MDINAIMAELAEYIRMQEDAAAMVENLKDQLKTQMTAAGVDTLAGAEHKATYKAVTSSRVGHNRPKKGATGHCSPVHKNNGNTPFHFRIMGGDIMGKYYGVFTTPEMRYICGQMQKIHEAAEARSNNPYFWDYTAEELEKLKNLGRAYAAAKAAAGL